MKKRILSLLLALVMLLGIMPTTSFAASTVEEALGEVDIYNGGVEIAYLSINGTVRTQKYTYFRYQSSNGTIKEVPAYCVNPNTKGVPQTVGVGESIKYIANERASDPKVIGIVSNGYPHRSLGELKLDDKYQAYYATKMALWCYLLPHWNINNLKVAPGLSGADQEIANRVLAAAKEIYKRGTTYDYTGSPKITATPDRSVAYTVKIGGREYKQQVFTLHSETWVFDYDISVSFADPSSVPAGTRIVDMDNNDITTVTTKATGAGYDGKFKVLYPAESVRGQTGSVQLAFGASVARYAAMYAICAETNKYGTLQNYICDTDNVAKLELAAISNYYDEEEDIPSETTLRIIKLEEGTDIPLDGAVFSVVDPTGKKIGSYSTGPDGTITIPLTLAGHYTVTEDIAPLYHLLPSVQTQHVDVEYGKMAQVTFWDAPYGSLKVQKLSDTGEALSGATIQIRHIESGETLTGTTSLGGAVIFNELKPGAWEVRELAGIEGWIADTETVQNITVISGKTVTTSIINKELPGLRIVKYDRMSMALMPNVSFEIFRDNQSLGIYQTDEFGEILLTDLPEGSYRIVERHTGDDEHIVDTNPQYVELKAGMGIVQLVFFNDKLPGMHLVKVDSSDLSKVIPNAKFRIEAVDGSWGPQEFTTGPDGTIDLSKLPVGSYVATELECPGYVIDDAQRIFYLDGNDNVQFIFTNSKLPSLMLEKISSDGTPLEGVAFRLAKIEDGSRYLDRLTGPDGTITWEGLEPGVYSLRETSTVSDHLLDPTEYHVELFPGRDSTIVIENQRRPNLTIIKRDADTGEVIPDTVFLVKAADGHSVQEVKTGPDGSATVENLLPGVYEVSEKSVPSPYLLDAASQLVTLYPNRDRTVYFENHKAPTIEIIKVDSITGNPLPNVRFQVWYASNNTTTGEYNDLGIFTTDENGRIDLTGPANGLRDGWFRVKELAPPRGYSIKDSDTQEAFVQAGKSHTFRFENTPLSAIVVWKYDTVTGAPVEGCIFQIRYLGGTSGTGGTVIGTYRTSVNGSFTVTGLAAGTYVIEEIASDANHVIDSAPQTVYLSGQDREVVQVFFGNAPKGNLLVKKVSTSANREPLSDVEFFVTKADGSVIGDANGKYVTDSTGSFLVENLEPGTSVVVREVRAKDGYLLDDTPQTIVILPGRTVTLEFRNQPTGGLIIQKLDSVTGEPLEGVEFELRYADGSYVDNGNLSSLGRYRTDRNGQIIISGITGTVVATEVKTLPGYTIHEETRSQTVQINPNDTQTLYFYNDPVGGIDIIKVNEADRSERIPNVTFEIRKAGTDELVDIVTTGDTGSVHVTLEDGAYYALEVDCPAKFKLDSTPHYFEVKDGTAPPLTVTNRAFSGILIHKIDSVTGAGIYGVTFLLYDAKQNPIGQYTSDQNGWVYIDDLPSSGRYYLRELENEGYILDTQLKTVYVEAGGTAEIVWKNTPITAQIQIWKKSADDNPINGLPAGTYLEGAVFEIYDKANNLVDTIRSNSRGLAVSKPLPLSRYTIREVQAPDYYSINPTVMTAYLEYAGQIVTFEVADNSVATGVSIQKTGYAEVISGQEIRYTVTGVANTSTVPLQSFYWRDTLPAQVTLTKLITGTYNQQLSYKIVYRTNLSGDTYYTLADNLSTSRTYVLDASPVALGLAANERVTEFMYVFGTVKAGFAQVETAYIYGTVKSGLANGSSFVNVADVGGLHNGQWIMAVSRWVTKVYAKTTPTLPRTGY